MPHKRTFSRRTCDDKFEQNGKVYKCTLLWIEHPRTLEGKLTGHRVKEADVV